MWRRFSTLSKNKELINHNPEFSAKNPVSISALIKY
jgi:hypothetical protein|tara:strand:+ start:459 stop:566 length:108 start_codon:yes stop_codon:yes gene_type:complete